MMDDQDVSVILAFTGDMMLSVIEQNWDVLTEMQVKQDKMLRDLFAVPGRKFSAEEKADLLEVQRLHQEILNIAESERTDVANELRTIKQGKTKASAYQML